MWHPKEASLFAEYKSKFASSNSGVSIWVKNREKKTQTKHKVSFENTVYKWLTRRPNEEQCNGEILPNVKPSHQPLRWRSLNREGSLSCRTCCDTGPYFTFEDCLSKKLLVDFRIVKDGILSYKQACYGYIWKIYINIKDISVSFFVDVMTTEASKVYTVLNKCWGVPRLTHCCSIEYCCKINYGCRELTDSFPHKLICMYCINESDAVYLFVLA